MVCWGLVCKSAKSAVLSINVPCYVNGLLCRNSGGERCGTAMSMNASEVSGEGGGGGGGEEERK